MILSAKRMFVVKHPFGPWGAAINVSGKIFCRLGKVTIQRTTSILVSFQEGIRLFWHLHLRTGREKTHPPFCLTGNFSPDTTYLSQNYT